MFTGEINEFINWTNGENSITGTSTPGVSEDNKISGQSIRNLILKLLLIPFVTNADDDGEKDKIYFFSSEYAKNLWKIYTDKTHPLADEEKASQLVLYSMDLPAVYRITGLDGFKTRYIIEGNTTSENAIVSFELGLVDSLNAPQEDTFNVVYRIEDENGAIAVKKTLSDQESGKTITISDIYRFLKSGRNRIYIDVSCNNHKAATSTHVDIYLVKFRIDTDIRSYYSVISNNSQNINFNISISRSITNLPITGIITVKEPGHQPLTAIFTNDRTEWTYDQTESNFSKQWSIKNIYSPNKKYTMEIRCIMSDLELGQSFSSNILIYQFEIASDTEINNRFINAAYSTSVGQYSTDSQTGDIVLRATQYVPFTMDWGYYTDIINDLLLVDVSWCIRTGTDPYIYYPITTITASKGSKPQTFKFVPNKDYSHELTNSYLVARGTINNVTYDIGEFPIEISKNSISVTEATGALKLSAYGKTNQSDTKNLWIDVENNVTTEFSEAVPFNDTCGWNNDSLILKGIGATATINYCPFPSANEVPRYDLLTDGAAFHIDFKPEYVENESDVLLTIGGSDVTAPRIIITPNSAGFYTGPTPNIKTNFKSGERISLTFIINNVDNTSNSGMVYVVNNGILERAGLLSTSKLYADSGVIRIGGTNSSIRIYSIRAYRTSIQVKLALSTYMFDNIDNSELLSRNDVYGNQDSILFNELRNKQDLIVISTNSNDLSGLYNILHNQSQKKNATVNIERISIDGSRDFSVTSCRVRNHGQSTLSYPITSMKLWFNKSNVVKNNVELTPEFVCTSQTYLGLGKNRYIMKPGSIPSNKFVLQANYADSSGTHNGSLLRLIQDTWYNALIDGEYKLRTAPLLFASGVKINHNDTNLGEPDIWKLGKVKTYGLDGEDDILYTQEEIDEHNTPLLPYTWIEGYYNVKQSATNKKGENIYNSAWAGKTWPEITNVNFPYIIRNAADSFPCTVFYKEGEGNLTLLGQYVFMDDKKSDYVFGERSIYYTDDISDPFCLKIENSKKDDGKKRVWDNEDVLLIEVVYPNSPLTSYCSKTIADSYTIDENDDTIIHPTGEQHNYNDIYYLEGSPVSYYWELHFELIYPDEGDLSGNKFQQNSEFVKKTKPFLDFLEWITDCKLKYNEETKWWLEGDYNSTQEAFEATAHDHLDMYKLAAYYIFFLRFGLVDSVERNALLKTYDGKHWHYEPWDMDIALGCANNGIITYEPPLSRDSKRSDGVTYAFSGRTGTQSNTLWDCLEGWTYWSDTVVPKVADALFKAGLSYKNAAKMFDEEYVEKWSETLYNESGHYKYIDAASEPKWRLYLNGARTSHRHWWLSKSMNYYDAKWGCGDFTTHSILFRILKGAGSGSMTITPNSDTYFKSVYGMQGSTQQTPFGVGLYHADLDTPATIPAEVELNDKMFCFIYGASAINELDFSGMLAVYGSSVIDIDFGESYDDVLGASIKSLKLGEITTPNIYTNPNENSYTSRLNLGKNGITGLKQGSTNDALENLEHLDIIGWSGDSELTSTWLTELFTGLNIDRKNIKTLYAMGCNKLQSFSTSSSGNNFTDIRLPDSIVSITMNNSSWENLSFWSTTENQNIATYTNVGIPASIVNMYLTGSTGKNECSWTLINAWITSIRNKIISEHPDANTEEIEELLLTDTLDGLPSKTLIVDLAYWGTTTALSYNDLLRLYAFNGQNAVGKTGKIKGYVRIHEDNITALQLSKLLDMFGANVFNIGSQSANLVVDNESNIVRISVSPGNGVTITGQLIVIEEGNLAVISANHFMLTADAVPNVVIDNDVITLVTREGSVSLSRLNSNTYYWGITTRSTDHNVFNTWYQSLSYVGFTRTVTNKLAIRASVGDGNDYTVYIKVYYKNLSGDIQENEVTINIKAATYPTDYQLYVTDKSNSQQGKLFFCTQRIATDIFTSEFSQHNQQQVPSYIMPSNGCRYEFSLDPIGDFTAPITNIEYRIRNIDNGANDTGWISYDLLNVGDSSVLDIGHDDYLAYTRDSLRHGIILLVKTFPDNSPYARYALLSRITVGASTIIYRYANILVMLDTSPIISSGILAGHIRTKYTNDYGYVIPSGDSIYKYLLLGLDGTLTISNDTNLDSLETNYGTSIFLYTKYLTGVSITGCTNLHGSSVFYNFSGTPELTTLSLKGCTGINTGSIDLTNNLAVTSVDLEDTSLGIIVPENSALTTLKLGSPTTISIDSPSVLRSDGVTIQDSSLLTSIILKDINKNTTYGFRMFNVIYNPS